jgi:hypothetical protein
MANRRGQTPSTPKEYMEQQELDATLADIRQRVEEYSELGMMDQFIKALPKSIKGALLRKLTGPLPQRPAAPPLDINPSASPRRQD